MIKVLLIVFAVGALAAVVAWLLLRPGRSTGADGE